jgi:hypothetical protein
VYISLIFGALALALTYYVLCHMPHDRVVKSLGVFLLKLAPFVAASLSIATLDVSFLRKERLGMMVVYALFLIIFCVFVPKIFFYHETFERLYYTILMMVPLIILALTFSFRLGGGSPLDTLRMSFGLLFLMISGIEDLAFLTINKHTDPRWATIPEIWDWASHIKVRLGHYPSKYEAYIFICVHVGIALFILFYPFKLLKKLNDYLRID